VDVKTLLSRHLGTLLRAVIDGRKASIYKGRGLGQGGAKYLRHNTVLVIP
jgi:hypothetical protein